MLTVDTLASLTGWSAAVAVAFNLAALPLALRARRLTSMGATDMSANAVLALLAAAGLAASTSVAAATPNRGQAEAGQRLAQRHCGGCHAVAAGASPLADAPPFRDIHRRYGPDGLRGLLLEGMIKPSPMPEEGSVRTHPRMPMAELGEDETADLVAYLRSLEPAPAKGCHSAGRCR